MTRDAMRHYDVTSALRGFAKPVFLLFGDDDPSLAAHRSSTPPTGYEIVELTIASGSPAVGRRVAAIAWPPNQD